jgi:hypothetical protein
LTIVPFTFTPERRSAARYSTNVILPLKKAGEKDNLKKELWRR